MISFSLAASAASISFTVSSVAFCTSCLVALLVVLGNRVILEQFLENVETVAAHVAHGDARLLGVFMRDLDEFLAALLVQFRHANAQNLPFHRRLKAQIRVANRLVDGDDERLVPDLHREQPRLRHADRGDLIERRDLPISVDMNRIEQARRGASGAQAAELVLERRERALHAALQIRKIESFRHVA